MTKDRERPLKDEAGKRAEWRGEDEPPRPESGGHTLPASEDEDERAEGQGAPAGAVGPLTTAPPPD